MLFKVSDKATGFTLAMSTFRFLSCPKEGHGLIMKQNAIVNQKSIASNFHTFIKHCPLNLACTITVLLLDIIFLY